MPASLSEVSWVFTLVAIFLLAIGNQDFLVSITDFMMLISLGIISLSAIWLRRRRQEKSSLRDALPLAVGLGSLIFGGSVYFITPTVVVFGSLAVLFSYLLFDILELGSLGVQVFLAVFDLSCLSVLSLFPHSMFLAGSVSLVSILGPDQVPQMTFAILVASALLAVNVVVDVRLLRRTALPHRI